MCVRFCDSSSTVAEACLQMIDSLHGNKGVSISFTVQGPIVVWGSEQRPRHRVSRIALLARL